MASAHLSPLIPVEHTGITDVHLPLQFAEIRHIAWVTEDNVIAAISEDRSNPALQHLDVPRGAGEAYQLTAGDLATGIRNRTLTANDLPAFQQRYPQSQVQRLIEEIQWLLVNPPGARRPVPEQHGMLYQEVEVAPFVELALLDPNIARLAGLYWVDRKPPAGGSALYLIAGVYPGRPEKYLRGLCFVSPNSSLPAFTGPPHARQIPGMVYNGRTPLGKAGLELQVMSLSLGRNRAVLFDAVRHAGGQDIWLTETRLQAVRAAPQLALQDAPLPTEEDITYTVTPIDLFGQAGPPVTSVPIRLQDLEAPTPPKNLRARLDQQGYPWLDPETWADLDVSQGSLALTFEYGESQQHRSPDAVALEARGYTGEQTDLPTDFASWNLLKRVAVIPPLEGSIDIGHSGKTTEIDLLVRAARAGRSGLQSVPGRLVPLPADSADVADLTAESTFEVLVNVSLLEPNLFAGYRCTLNGVTYQVAACSAGLAYDQDSHPLKARTACLHLEGSTPPVLTGNEMARLIHPQVAALSVGQIQAVLNGTLATFPTRTPLTLQLTLNAALRPFDSQTSGGEVAVDFNFRHWRDSAGAGVIKALSQLGVDSSTHGETLIGRVVSAAQESGRSTTVLARFDVGDALRLALVERSPSISLTGRLYTPYLLRGLTVSTSGGAADIQVQFRDVQRFERIWLTAAALEADGRGGAAAPPLEQRIVRPPMRLAVSPPYPCGDAATVMGFADMIADRGALESANSGVREAEAAHTAQFAALAGLFPDVVMKPLPATLELHALQDTAGQNLGLLALAPLSLEPEMYTDPAASVYPEEGRTRLRLETLRGDGTWRSVPTFFAASADGTRVLVYPLAHTERIGSLTAAQVFEPAALSPGHYRLTFSYRLDFGDDSQPNQRFNHRYDRPYRMTNSRRDIEEVGLGFFL